MGKKLTWYDQTGLDKVLKRDVADDFDFEVYLDKLDKYRLWGHLRLASLLRQHYRPSLASDDRNAVGDSDIVCQFSSVGSLGSEADNWLTSEFQQSLSTSSSNTTPTHLKLIYPTVDDVRNCFEGYRGGGSLPFNQMNLILFKKIKAYPLIS